MKKIFGVIIAGLLLLTACSDAETGKVDQNEAQNQNDQSKAPEVYAVGDTVKYNHLQITLHGVTESQGSEFFSPSNDKYLLVDLTIENTGDEPEAVSTLLQMELMDADSYTYSIALYPDTKGSLDGEIAPGRKMRGEVAFDVPESEYYEFIFSDPFVTGQAIWKIE